MQKNSEMILKLRQELVGLRQLKNKLRRREYNRKAKASKVLEKRKRRREYIMKEIEDGNMDKSSLALVYSRKKLPCDQVENTPAEAVKQQLRAAARERSRKAGRGLKVTPSGSSMAAVAGEQQLIPVSTATVEYVIEHDETAAAVAGIPGHVAATAETTDMVGAAQITHYRIETQADEGGIVTLPPAETTTVITVPPLAGETSDGGEREHIRQEQEHIDIIMEAVDELNTTDEAKKKK